MSDKLRSVKVTYSDGSQIETSMAANLSDQDIKDYFKVGKEFNIGSGGKDKMVTVKKVEILEDVKEAFASKGAEQIGGTEYPYEELQKKISYADKKVIYRIISVINQSDDKKVTMTRVSKLADDAMERLEMGDGNGLPGISKRSGVPVKDIVNYIQYIVVGDAGDNVDTVKPDGGKVQKLKESEEVSEAIEYSVGDTVDTPLGNGKIVKQLSDDEFAVKIGPEGTEEYHLPNHPLKFKSSELQGKIEESEDRQWFEIPYSSIFDSIKYDIVKFSKIASKNGATNITTVYSHGMKNQPKIVRFKASKEQADNIESDLEEFLETPWVRVDAVKGKIEEKSDKKLKGRLGNKDFSIDLGEADEDGLDSKETPEGGKFLSGRFDDLNTPEKWVDAFPDRYKGLKRSVALSLAKRDMRVSKTKSKVPTRYGM